MRRATEEAEQKWTLARAGQRGAFAPREVPRQSTTQAESAGEECVREKPPVRSAEEGGELVFESSRVRRRRKGGGGGEEERRRGETSHLE